MGVEVVYAAVAAGMFAAGWCSKRHACRDHTHREARVIGRAPRVVTARRVPELERSNR